MKTFVEINAAGAIVRRATIPDDAPDPQGMIPGPSSGDPHGFYWSGEWLQRPDCPEPLTVSLPTGGVMMTWAVAGAVEVMDAETGVVFGTAPDTDGLITVTLPDPGAYQIELTPSGPELPWRGTIEVLP